MKFVLTLLLCLLGQVFSEPPVSVPLATLQPAAPQICTPDGMICMAGDYVEGSFYWRGQNLTTYSTVPGKPLYLLIHPGVSLVGWTSKPVSYNPACQPSVIFCGIDLSIGFPICQHEWSRCGHWEDSTPFNRDWLILNLTFYDVELVNLYYQAVE